MQLVECGLVLVKWTLEGSLCEFEGDVRTRV